MTQCGAVSGGDEIDTLCVVGGAARAMQGGRPRRPGADTRSRRTTWCPGADTVITNRVTVAPGFATPMQVIDQSLHMCWR